LIQHLPESVFVAIDEEMTGIQTGRLSKDDTPAERYASSKPFPERYSIIQVGICLFLPNPEYSHEHNMAAEYLVVSAHARNNPIVTYGRVCVALTPPLQMTDTIISAATISISFLHRIMTLPEKSPWMPLPLSF
jgi:hypothetical protein